MTPATQDKQVPEWADDEARRIVATAHLRAQREGRALWNAMVAVLGEEITQRGNDTWARAK